MLARLLFLFALAFPFHAQAGQGPAPESIKGGRVVTVEEAKAWFDSGKALFVDVRNPINYGRGHVPAAVAAPYEYPADREAFMGKLPREKSAPVVIYSHGPTGWKSYHASAAAVKSGYSNIMWMREGLEGWEEKGLDVHIGPEEKR